MAVVFKEFCVGDIREILRTVWTFKTFKVLKYKIFYVIRKKFYANITI